MVVKFLEPLANASQYPTPIVAATPRFKLMDLNVQSHANSSLENAIFTRNGRGAIGIAGSALKKPGKNVVLIPAYHCPALVEPFIWLEYEIRFYPVQQDLNVDMDVIAQEIEKGDVTHFVVVRYFGFGQNNDSVIEYLQQFPIAIIEDCAHSLFRFIRHFNHDQSPQVNASICSINKILPTIDGGALYLDHPYHANLSYVNWTDEAKACAFLLGIPQLVGKVKQWLRGAAPSNHDEPLEAEPSRASQLRYFQPVDLASASYRHTQRIFCHSDLDRIRKKRRKNFDYLVEHLDNPDVGLPLFTQLDDNDTPYVVPFLLRDAKHFETLRKLGIQILRWEEVAISDCEISQRYRSCLIQIPCHQKLSRSQLDFIADAVNRLTP